MDVEMTPGHGAGGCVDLKLGHHAKDGIEVVDVQGEIDTAPRLRELLIDLISKGNYQLVVNLDKVGFLDSHTGLRRDPPPNRRAGFSCTLVRVAC
jgi:hypothetical protein